MFSREIMSDREREWKKLDSKSKYRNQREREGEGRERAIVHI